MQLTFNVASWILGFRFSKRRFKDLMASLGCTLLDRTISEISRFSAISSLEIGQFDSTLDDGQQLMDHGQAEGGRQKE